MVRERENAGADVVLWRLLWGRAERCEETLGLRVRFEQYSMSALDEFALRNSFSRSIKSSLGEGDASGLSSSKAYFFFLEDCLSGSLPVRRSGDRLCLECLL